MSRIFNLQQRARELGRLRAGYTDGRRPVRSATWILTSHSGDFIRAAADEWGGTPERWQPLGNGAEQWRIVTDASAIDAILPPGDPLSQSNELWSGGGCQRRCDGVTELLSDQPCLCQAAFGQSWHTQPKGSVCSITSRLSVFLPAMPDLGVWRAESHSYYVASEMAATVDVIRSATDGLVPVLLRIEQRTKVAAGKTSQFPVIALELRGATTQQVLSGQLPSFALAAGPAATATAAPALPAAAEPLRTSGPNYEELLESATTEAELKDIWSLAHDCGDDTAELSERIKSALAALKARPPLDLDEQWALINSTVPEEWSSVTVDEEFTRIIGHGPARATAEDMATFLTWLRTEHPLPVGAR